LASINVVFVIASFVVLVLSLSFHEAAHAWTANRLGDPTAKMLGRLTLNPLAHIDWIGTVLFPLIAMFSGFPLIGWAKPVPVDIRNLRSPRRDFGLVALAGPVSNLTLACGAALVFWLLRHSPAGASVPGVLVNALLMAVVVNVLLALFNMIPVPPLDGGNVLMGIAPLGVARAVNLLRPYGFVILYVLMFMHVLDRVMRPVENLLLSWLL
jgi:Zn-dependent protease